ncbi:MAG: FMN-binding glutamate synthase family protein [bacterium]|nr:FMN-binding glutamate synthase family protein [bacterium]
MRTQFYLIAATLLASSVALSLAWSPAWILTGGLFLVTLLGVHDTMQRRRAVLRNFPVIGHFRYLLEMIRPEINQYFIESNTDGTPFNREDRSVVYQRAKRVLDTLPFGTQRDVYEEGYEWIVHSLLARHPPHEVPRVRVGAETCGKPYDAALLNVSAMSFGSLSSHAVLALNLGAKQGGFAHNTGEGGVSEYHVRHGGDLIWQIGTGYFGCRAADGTFDADRFRQTIAAHPSVKMVEIKLSQGAKPGHGGILPAAKLTPEIAGIRGVPLGQDVLSPPAHSAFTTPDELLDLIARLRELSGGLPVGIKLCVGIPSEFMALCKAMQRRRRTPDFIAVDGGEGGTGAAPIEFSNSVGMPLREGLTFVHNCLVGFDLRDRVKLIAAGKITSGFHMARLVALGADICCAARSMMMAIGCIQARRCNANDCPVGVATQKPWLVAGLDVESKAERAASFQHETVEGFFELLGAAGLEHATELTPHHIMRRGSDNQVRSYFDLYPFIERGALLFEPVPEDYEQAWLAASDDRFLEKVTLS